MEIVAVGDADFPSPSRRLRETGQRATQALRVFIARDTMFNFCNMDASESNRGVEKIKQNVVGRDP